jgi:hypothetical protein
MRLIVLSLVALLLLAQLCLFESTGATGNWNHLSFDSKNFFCDHYELFCEQILDEIGCSHNETQRINEGCSPGNNLGTDFVGTCTCLSPIYFDAAGVRVTQQLIQNRIAADVPWMLEPWNTGPPYDMIQSFTSICDTALSRLGCQDQYKVINATDYVIVNGKKQSNFVCNCGSMTEPSKQVNRMIMDKFNLYHMQSTPVFDDPVYLSVPVSICVTLILGKLGAIVAVYFKLPPIIGFLLVGLGIQNILNPMFLKGAGFPFPSPGNELKTIALIIVLMRAGLSIKFDEIYATALPTLLLCTLPFLTEFFLWMYVGQTFFHWEIIDMGLWASVMAPLGPSVVISGLLQLLANKKKDYGYPTKQIIISTPIEAVLAIVFFGIFQNLEQTSRSTLYPWVNPLPLWLNALLVPVNIMFSVVLGVIVGFFCSKYIDWRSHIKSDFIWVRANRNPQMGSSTADLVFVLVVLCYTMYSLCNNQYIQQCSGVLVVFVTCITVSILANQQVVIDLAQGLKGIWIFAEVFLFTLTGTSLSFDATNGPLYGQRGLDPENIKKVIGMMFIGVSGRLAAICIVTLILYSFMPPHRRNWKWMSMFAGVVWIYQLPKATVQATLGSVAYYQNTIPGDNGLKEGLFIAQATAFTVLIFAPLGALLTNYVGAPIAEHLTKLDKEAGWKHGEFKYSRSSPFYVPTEGDPGMHKDTSKSSMEDAGAEGATPLSLEVGGVDEETGLHEPETFENTAKALVDLFVKPGDPENGIIGRIRRNTFHSLYQHDTEEDANPYRPEVAESSPSTSKKHDDEEHDPGFFTLLRRNTLDVILPHRARLNSGDSGGSKNRSRTSSHIATDHHGEGVEMQHQKMEGTVALPPGAVHQVSFGTNSREFDASQAHSSHVIADEEDEALNAQAVEDDYELSYAEKQGKPSGVRKLFSTEERPYEGHEKKL